MREQDRLVPGLGLPPEWAEHLAASMFAQASVGLVVFDADLRVIAANAAELFQRAPVRVGDHADSLFARLGLDDTRTLLRQALAGDTPIIGKEPVTARADDGSVLWLRLAVFRIPPQDARPLGLLVTFNDVTGQRRADARAAVLHDAAAFGSSLNVATTTQQLADLLVPSMADLAAVDLAEAVVVGEEPVRDPDTGYTPSVRTAVAQIGPSWPTDLSQLGESPVVPANSPEAFAMERGATLLVPAVMPTAETIPPEVLRKLVPEGGHSLLAVPLFARGLLLGAVQLWRTERKEPFDEADARLLEELSSRAALSVDNARRFTRERRVALALQHSLLPRERTDEPAAETFGAYLPTASAAGVGGDWYDVIPLSSLRVALVVGDVVGHGLAASATMGRLRTAVQALADMDLPPDELLTHLDDLVLRLPSGPDGSGIAGATCLYAEYDPVAGRCRMASAGHPPPALVEPDGHSRYVDLEAGPPLGVGGMPFEVVDIALAPGSVLALYSDGLISGADHDLDRGMHRLLARLEQVDCLHRDLEEAGHDVLDALSGATRADDTTLLLGRLHPLPDDDSVIWEFPADPACVGEARDLALRQLVAWGLDELDFTTELIVSELVTNAVRYGGGGPVSLRLIRGTVLVCEVSDPSNTQPRLRRARTTDEGGRGLFLVAQLTRRWGSRYQQTGKTIWAEQTIPEHLAR